jgi:hypothetical protein
VKVRARFGIRVRFMVRVGDRGGVWFGFRVKVLVCRC